MESNPNSNTNTNGNVNPNGNANSNTGTSENNKKIIFSKEQKDQIQKELKEIHEKIAKQQAIIPPGGTFITFTKDGEYKRLEFTGEFKHVNPPKKDFKTGEIKEGKFSDIYYFKCYDITDPANKSELSVWQRGPRDANTILSWFSRNQNVFDITRHGQPGNNQTSYEIFPVLEQAQTQ